MKAIIISDADARALLNKLELVKFRDAPRSTPERLQAFEDVYRAFHFVVCSWLQEQGADCNGR